MTDPKDRFQFPTNGPGGFGSPFGGGTSGAPANTSYGSPRWPEKLNRGSSRTKLAIGYAVGFLVVIWAVQLLNMLLGYRLIYWGIHPLDVSSLWHILTSPFIHLSIAHIVSNSVPGAIFVFLVALSGRRAFWEVTIISILVGGIGTWLFGGPGTSHVGASGVIYGWLAYLIVRGAFNRSFSQIALGVFLAFSYSGLFWGMFPNEPGISWQGHLFGAVGGVLAGAIIKSDDPPALVAKRQQKQLRK